MYGGLGSAETAITITQGAGAAATTGLVTAGVLAASSAWIPIIGAGVLGVTLAIGAISKRGRQRTAATQIVDELEPQLKANRDAYFSGPRTRASQQVALANFDQAWSLLTSSQGCGQDALGKAGKRCISDRDRGGQWDWFSYYRDPIEGDTQILDSSTLNTVSQLFPATTQAELLQLDKLLPFLALAVGVALL